MELQTISDYSEYMDYLFGMKTERDMYFAVNGGGASIFQTDNIDQIEKLKRLGMTYYPTDRENGFAYIGVLENGSSVYEKKSDNNAEHYYCNKNGEDINLKSISSSPTDLGSAVASIKVNNAEYSVNRDGINIVIYDNRTKCVIDSIAVFMGEDGNLALSHRAGSDLIQKYKVALYNIDRGLPL